MHNKLAASITIALAALFACPAGFANDEAAARDAFNQGKTLLAEGRLDQALAAYKSAAEKDPEELNYQVQAAVLERVIKMRAGLDKLENTPKWLPMVIALNAYYLENKAYAPALEIAAAAHAKAPSTETAALTARTRLEMEQPALADDFLDNLDPKLASTETRILHGIALARLGEYDAAKAALAAAKSEPEENFNLLFDRARLVALIGDSDEAAAALVKCFENTPPSRLYKLKARAGECHDFASIHDAEAYAAALDTKSKVKESSCSSGVSCSQCPSRTSCSTGSAQDKPEQEKKEKP